MFRYSDYNDPGYEKKLADIKNERIKNLDTIYKSWERHYWKFTGNMQRLNAIPLTVIDMMRDAYGSYISDFFNSTILLSSVAVETMIHFILKLHGIQHCDQINKNQVTSYDVNTIDGVKKYGFYKNRFGEFIQCPDQKEYFCELESLNRSIDECKNLNYDISPLDQRVNKGNKYRLFVVRRDTVAHGNFEGLGLTQELVDIEKEQLSFPKEVFAFYYLCLPFDQVDQYHT